VQGEKAMSVNNDDLIRAIFAATDEAKKRALEILEGKEPPLENDEPLLVTMGQACELIPCSRATLWRICKAGRLSKVEIYPNAYRLRRSDVVALAAGKGVSND
jgi:hypothetical protein